jgi:alkylation response protein AidB-like acyl-CoA dehydrogenase
MSMSHHYKSNLRDIFFNLFEVCEIQKHSFGQGPFQMMDEETARVTLAAFEELCTKEIAPSFAPGDRATLTLDSEGNVTLPKVITEALEIYYGNEWEKLDLPEHLGGFGATPSVIWSAYELVVGANPVIAFYVFGTFICRVIDMLGTEEQKARYVDNMLKGHWGGAMVLTEPDAGSDVGAGRSTARHIENDVWELEGVKRFITSADYDYPDNIVQLVLARPEGGAVGTKGLSMFIVPKYWVEKDGSLGERNGVFVTNIEKKMGLHASCTCEVTMGGDIPCRGLLVGNVHDGIRQMFNVIEHARMAVGLKSMSTLSTAYLNALEYTKERVQGPDLKDAASKTAPKVEIIRHPDVRRMLMSLKSHSEGLRALGLYAASIQDKVTLLGGHKAPEAQSMHRLNNLLLPLIKGYGSEKGYELLSVALQCFGGSGYCKDYPMEQYIRDQKIDSLYEGTTHIQSLDLFFRKIARDGGVTLQGLMGEIQKTLVEAATLETLAMERASLEKAVNDVGGILMVMMKKVPESVYHVGFHGNRILMAIAEVVIGWRLVMQSIIAHGKLAGASEKDRAFYEGKIASARFFCAEVLPQLTSARKIIEAGTLDLMDLNDESF